MASRVWLELVRPKSENRTWFAGPVNALTHHRRHYVLENKKLLNSVEFVSLSTIKLPGLLHLQGVTLPLQLLLVLWTEIALFGFVLAAIFDHQ